MVHHNELMDYEETRALLGDIPKGTMRSMVSRREIPFVRINRRTVRFRRSEIEAWLAARSVLTADVSGNTKKGSAT